MTKDSSIGVCWVCCIPFLDYCSQYQVKFKRIFNPESPNTPVPINFKLTKYIHRYHPQHVSCETTSSSSSSNHGMLKGYPQKLHFQRGGALRIDLMHVRYFLFENSPMYGQMVDGVHTENGKLALFRMISRANNLLGVFRGTALLAGLPKPMLIRHPGTSLILSSNLFLIRTNQIRQMVAFLPLEATMTTTLTTKMEDMMIRQPPLSVRNQILTGSSTRRIRQPLQTQGQRRYASLSLFLTKCYALETQESKAHA